MTASPGQGIAGLAGQGGGQPAHSALGQTAAEAAGRTRANRRLTAAQRQAAMGLAGPTATPAELSGEALGSSESSDVTTPAADAASRRALRAFPTANRADLSRTDSSASAWPGLSPRQAALRQIAGSAGQPLAPVVRRMMEMALGATFADVRVHTGSAAGGAAQALGAQAFTMGRDIYFAPGKFEPGAAPGIALLAHELTHTLQGAAVPLRKAAPGAPALAAGEAEPERS